MFTLEYAKNPVYLSEDKQQILLNVKWEEFNEEMLFNATSYDTEAHGVDLFNRATEGEFGEIKPYIAPLNLPEMITEGTQTL